MANKVMPNNLEAEESVLGACFLSKYALQKATENLAPESFYNEKNAKIFSSMIALTEEKTPIDLTTITSYLKKKNELKQVNALVQKACEKKIERDRKRGIKNRPVRAMIVGIPNVGKSTFINSFAGKACAKTGNKPGVTKGKQWIRLNKQVELLDTPGILWPKFEDQTVGQHLAFIGSIKDELIQSVELALDLIEFLTASYPGILGKTYSVDESEDSVAILNAIAVNRGCLKKGNELDHDKAAFLLLDDFRNARLGKISVENPQDGENNGN